MPDCITHEHGAPPTANPSGLGLVGTRTYGEAGAGVGPSGAARGGRCGEPCLEGRGARPHASPVRKLRNAPATGVPICPPPWQVLNRTAPHGGGTAEIPALGLTPWRAVACAPQHWTGSRPEVALHSSSAAQRTSLFPRAQRQLCSDRGESICPTVRGRMTPCLSARARVAEGWVGVHNCPRSSEHR